MRFFLAGLGLHLRRLVRRPAVAACLLALPALSLVLGLLLGPGGANPARVGVVLPGLAAPAGTAEANRAETFWQALEAYNSDTLQFIQAPDADTLEQLVAAGVWECGYLLPEDLDARAAAGRYGRLVTRLDGPANTLAGLADWPIEAALLQACAPDIALAYAGRAGLLAALTDQQLAEARAAAFGSRQPMAVQVVPAAGETTGANAVPDTAPDTGSGATAHGREPTPEGQPTSAGTPQPENAAGQPATGQNPPPAVQSGQSIQNTPTQAAPAHAAPTQAGLNTAAMVRGLTALLMLMLACLCAAHLAQDAPGLARLRPLRTPAGLLLPAYTAVALLAGLAGGAALAVMGALIPGSLPRPGLQAAALGLYLLALCGFAFLLANLLPGRQAMACALPLLLVACLVFCPIFFNLALLLPAAGWVAALLPPTPYLRAAAGSAPALGQLALMAAAFPALGALAARLRKKSSAAL